MDEIYLVKNCQSGDMDAFNDLYKKYSPQAFRTAYLITGSREFAEDIVQETFVKCYYEVHNLKDPKAFKAWFYRILTNLCWRLKPKEKYHISIDELSDKGLDIFQSEMGLEDSLEAKELRKIVREAINTLEPSLKTVIILYYFNNLSIREIAKVMKCFEGTVKSRLYYARKGLMRIIENNHLVEVYFNDFIEGKEYGFNEKASLF